MKKRWIEILLNLIFWIASSWIIITGFSVESRDIRIINGVETIEISRNEDIQFRLAACILLSSLLFYFNLWKIGKLKSGRNRISVAVFTVLAFAITLAMYMILRRTIIFPEGPELPVSLIAGIMVLYFTVSVGYAIFNLWRHSEKQQQKLLLEKKLAELSLLRSRLHPHFLFNVLNNLLAMVDQKSDPVLASSIDRLSGLLRYVVYETSESKVPVIKEIDFIRNFAALQMLRFEKDEVVFDMEVRGNHENQPLEPGIFIPFVENAFKYGVEPENHSSIHIKFDVTKSDRIQFVITNPVFESARAHENSGSGINSVVERLRLVYPGRHTLIIHRDGLYTVQLEISTHEGNNR